MKELQAGIIGMGVMGMLHASTLNSLKNVKVVAVTGTEKMVKEDPTTTFIDKSVRVQDVKKGINPEFHSLISNFGNTSGTPVLLNTSFNRSGQAIVHTPEQALHDLKFSGLDCLVLENYLVKKG